jgi:hypothetical protein
VEHYDEVVFSQPQDDFARRVNAANAVGRGPAPYTEITPNCAPPSLSPSLLSETKLDHLSHALTHPIDSYLDSSALGLVRRERLIGYFPIHLFPPLCTCPFPYPILPPPCLLNCLTPRLM